MLSKQRIVDALRTRISADLESLKESQRRTQAGAVHEETRQEDDKDTRAIEASYLARGLAERVETLQHAASALQRLPVKMFDKQDPIAIGALVTLDTPQGEMRYFITPVAGGLRVCVEGVEVTSITPNAPLGQALIGLTLDDEVEFKSPHGMQRFEIVEIY